MKKENKGFRRFGALIAATGLLVSIVAIVLLVGDIEEFQNSWNDIQWQYLIWLAPLAILNHAVRYWRWEILIKHASQITFKRSQALILFSTGSLLIFTPGRIGEIAKSIYTRDFFGIPIAKSLPVLIAERLADMLVMALLASLGLLLIGTMPDWQIAGIVVLAILIIATLRTSVFTRAATWILPRFLENRGFGEFLKQAHNSMNSLLTHRMLFSNFAIGTGAWILEVFIFFLSLYAVGIDTDSNLFVLALAVFPLASLAGSLSFLPGGIGATEGGLVAFGIILGGVSEESVLLASLLARAAILGIVVLAGVISLLLFPRILGIHHNNVAIED